MTDQDRPPENFLERWSRRKVEAQRGEGDAPRAADAMLEQRSEPTATTTALPFDVSNLNLPSLESITGVTDIRAFLAPGVPQELARAALRRAWANDPAIRNFVGLQENDWDFTKPEGVPGFGPLPPDIDIKKLITQIFGGGDEEPTRPLHDEAKKADEVQTASASKESACGATPSPLPEGTDRPPHAQLQDYPAIVQRSGSSASRGQEPQSAALVESVTPQMPRRHGSALPKV
jgi:hypothetical protein